MNDIWSDLSTANTQLFIEEADTGLCKNCKSDDLTVTIEYDVVCMNCGTVNGREVSDEAEWLNYTENPEKSKSLQRAETTTTDYNPFKGESLNTLIPKGLIVSKFVNEEGKTIKYDVGDKYNKMSINYKEKSFWQTGTIFQKVCEDMGIKKQVLDTAKYLWGEISKQEILTRGDPRKCLYVYCVYYAAMHLHQEVEIDILVKKFGITNTKKMNQADKIFREVFKNHPVYSSVLNTQQDYTRTYSDVYYFLDIDFVGQQKISSIYKELQPKILGIAPKTLISGIVCYYLVEIQKQPDMKKKISEVMQICVPTMEKAYTVISKYYKNKK